MPAYIKELCGGASSSLAGAITELNKEIDNGTFAYTIMQLWVCEFKIVNTIQCYMISQTLLCLSCRAFWLDR
uniref:Uncharacterized protein n=1 Tax=Oryzias latipes TaxID=8090 RepID=A0A3P9MND3_ORYLA